MTWETKSPIPTQEPIRRQDGPVQWYTFTSDNGRVWHNVQIGASIFEDNGLSARCDNEADVPELAKAMHEIVAFAKARLEQAKLANENRRLADYPPAVEVAEVLDADGMTATAEAMRAVG